MTRSLTFLKQPQENDNSRSLALNNLVSVSRNLKHVTGFLSFRSIVTKAWLVFCPAT